MRKRRILVFLILVLLVTCGFVGCTNNKDKDKDDGNKIPETNEEGSDNWTGVLIVVKNNHVVNTVRKPRQNRELERVHEKDRIKRLGRAVKMEIAKQQTEKSPTAYVKGDGFDFSLLKSCTDDCHKSL